MQEKILIRKMEGYPNGVTYWEAIDRKTGEVILAGYISRYQIEQEALSILKKENK